MKCRHCGGNLLFKNSVYQCSSCNAIFSLDSIYENIDVCICYEENDAAGRRTRDSIVAQEVYRKLEEYKISTFYERISADGIIGENLETCKIAAIHRAKAIIVLGTSAELFAAIEEKYSEYINGKPVIPFCVDINPGAIPKTLSKIQAMSYSTIGWDKDLIKGINNILGREQDVDTVALYGRRKSRMTVVSIVSTVTIIAFAVVLWFFMGPDNAGDDLVMSVSSTVELIEESEKQLTQKEIYDNANVLLNQGDFIGALELFLQIPEHPNSANMIKQIYSRYSGYYWDDNNNLSLHLVVSGNKKADVEINCNINGIIVKVTESGQINTNEINLQYIDSENNSGNLILNFNNDVIALNIKSDEASPLSIGEKEIEFLVAEKTDKPYSKIPDRETLLDWVAQKIDISEISQMGFELEDLGPMFAESRGMDAYGYKIKNTDIMFFAIPYGEEHDSWLLSIDNYDFNKTVRLVVGIEAPAGIMLPEKVGETAVPFVAGDYMYAPFGEFISSPNGFSMGYPSKEQIERNTPVTVMGKPKMPCDAWEDIYSSTIGEYLGMLLIEEDAKLCTDGRDYVARHTCVLSQNDNYILIAVVRDMLVGNLHVPTSASYYSVNKNTYDATFVYEYEIPENGDYWDEWERHPDLFSEFIDFDDNLQNENNDDVLGGVDLSENPLEREFSDWKEAYLYFTEYTKNECDSYALVYVDADDIPELYTRGISEAGGDGLISFKNGKLFYLQLERIGGGRYIENAGIVYNFNGSMGHYYTDVYELGAEGFSSIFNASIQEDMIENDIGDYEFANVYYVDGIAVTEEEYSTAVNKVFNLEQSIPLNKYAVEYGLIKDQINNYE